MLKILTVFVLFLGWGSIAILLYLMGGIDIAESILYSSIVPIILMVVSYLNTGSILPD